MFGAGPRPDLRRRPRAELAIFCVRVDLDDARPSIWRRLDLRSEVTLDVLHQVLQAAFSWDDYHLHRFSLGGRPFDRVSQVFLCPYDADNPEFEDGDGPEASQVRLDQTLHDLGDKLHYLYDYGDNWELTLHSRAGDDGTRRLPHGGPGGWPPCGSARRHARWRGPRCDATPERAVASDMDYRETRNTFQDIEVPILRHYRQLLGGCDCSDPQVVDAHPPPCLGQVDA